MTTQWISERNPKGAVVQNNDQFKTQSDFIAFVSLDSPIFASLIADLADMVASQTMLVDIEMLRERAQQNEDLVVDPDMMLTVSCAWALGNYPNLVTWTNVRKIARHSWQLEHWLHEAMSGLSKIYEKLRNNYVELAKVVFDALHQGELKSETERKNVERSTALQHWRKTTYKLDEIWWGLRAGNFMNYEEEMPILEVLNEIEPDELLRLISESDDPFLVDAGMIAAGVSAFNPRFSQWEKYARQAPLAFEENGSWNGSVMLPLLLVHARDHLLNPGRQVPRNGANENEVAELTAEVLQLIRAVVEILEDRDDSVALFSRWGSWLMRELLRQGDPDIRDIRSNGFVDNALIEAIGRSVQGKTLIANAPQDAAPWEAWSHVCVLSSFAHDGFAEAPPFQAFASQWLLSPEDWRGPSGRRLVERANLHLFKDDIPGLAANLFAFPLASGDAFALGWQQVWDGADQLREVVEFGSADSGPDSYSDQTDASRLLLLLGRMGLACFDQAATRIERSHDEQTAEQIIRMHELLYAAATEMLQIDKTLNRDKWHELMHHLAIRRVYWDANYIDVERTALFQKEHLPTIRNYLENFQTEPSRLIHFLHACMLNRLNTSEMRTELIDAAVDLGVCIQSLAKLNKLRPERYRLDSRAVDMVRPLMSDLQHRTTSNN
ncbi:hypothetical protein [Burkholderia cepacia]|uniref:hypothetical protein n=1 Tax=Burkholderia cepacia TaxID=292 RepID=UPI0009BEBD26|nr:hypothetical protein [Burkholderia cepacia]